MRDFNKVNPSLWGSKKFQSLGTDGKLIYLYFLTSPHSNSSGCYRCKIGYMVDDIGISRDDVIKGIERVSDTLLISFDMDEEIVFIRNWFVYNPPSNPNHAKKVLSDIVSLQNSRLKILALEDFSQFVREKNWHVTENIDKIIDDFRKGIERVSKGYIEISTQRQRPDGDQTEIRQRPDGDETLTGDSPQADSENSEIDEAVSLFNDLADSISLPKVQKLSQARKSKLKARLSDCGGIGGWKAALEKVKASSFLRGDKGGWKADFDFIITESKFSKIMEGSYDNFKSNKISKYEEIVKDGF